MKTLFRIVIACIILAVVMVITNPSVRDHRMACREKLAEKHGLTDYLFGDLASRAVTYEDHVFFSVGRIWDTDISYGAFGYVFVLPLEPEAR